MKLQYGLVESSDGLWLRLVVGPTKQEVLLNVTGRPNTHLIERVIEDFRAGLRAGWGSEVLPVQLNQAADARVACQNGEFQAVEELSKQWKRLQMTSPVDDDYPAVRHDYEGALRGFLVAAKANGRTMP